MNKLITLLGILTGLTANAQLPATTNQFIPQENYGINYGFENGKSGHVNSAGTFSITSTAANVARGQFAASMDFSATGQTLTLASRAIPSGLFANNCIAEAMVKGGDANITMQVYDGSNVIASQVLSAYATYTKVSIPFICPSSGTMTVRLLSSADAAIVYLDDVFMGANYRVGTVAQAQFIGRVTFPATASCEWSTVSGTFANFSADADCTLPAGSNIEGSVVAPDTKIPAIKIPVVKPGRYVFMATGSTYADSTGNPAAVYRFHDGTNAFKEEVRVFKSGPQILFGSNVYGEITYTTAQTNLTVQIQALNDGSTAARLAATQNPLNISVYYYPSNSDTVYAPNMQAALGWVDFEKGTADTSTTSSSFITLSNANWGTRSNKGVCTTGASANDVSCKIASLPAGKYLVRAHLFDLYGGSSTYCNAALYDGTTYKGQIRTQDLSSSAGVSGGSDLAAIYEYASQQSNITFEVQWKRGSGANSCVVEPGNNGGATGFTTSIEVIPLEQGLPMPVVLNSVQTSYAGQVRSEFANITNSGSCAVASGSSGFIGSISHPATGKCAITFGTAFSSIPSCTCTVNGTSGRVCAISTATTTTGLTTNTDQPGGGDVDLNYSLQCIGIK